MILAAEKKFWILDPLYNALGGLLSWFYAVVPSYGFAIVMLTLAVRLVLYPLTAKQVKSQQAMQKLQPELKRLQAKYKGDRVKLNEEMMKLYKEQKVNPLAGCLPLLLQAPLFIVLYRLIMSLSDKSGPKHLPVDSALYESLKESGGKMVSFGMDLSQRASEVNGAGKAIPFYILIAIVVATGYYQQKQITSRTPKESLNPQMQMMGKVLPAFFGLISLSMPAGVVVYFAVSNMWQIGQQALTFRRRDSTTAGDGAIGVSDGKAQAKGSAPAGAGPDRAKPVKPTSAAGNGSGGKKGAKARDAGRAGRAGKARSAGKAGKRGGQRPPPSPRPKGLPPKGAANHSRKPKRKDT